MGSAPAARADRRETRPIGPAPLYFSRQKGPYKIGQYERAHQTSTGSPRRRSALSMPAKATDNGSQREPSSKLTLSGRRWSHAAGWRCHRVKVPTVSDINKYTGTRSTVQRPTVIWWCREKDNIGTWLIRSQMLEGKKLHCWDVHALYLPTRQKSQEGLEQGTPASMATRSPIIESSLGDLEVRKRAKSLPAFH